MKKTAIFNLLKPVKFIYHFFALTGFITTLVTLISWSGPEQEINPSAPVVNNRIPDVNITGRNAKDYIAAYRTAYLGTESRLPKGYFISRQAINWLLSNENLGGIYVYPALTPQGVICTVLEGGNNANAKYSIIEGIEGRVMMSESTCPNDCGSLGE